MSVNPYDLREGDVIHMTRWGHNPADLWVLVDDVDGTVSPRGVAFMGRLPWETDDDDDYRTTIYREADDYTVVLADQLPDDVAAALVKWQLVGVNSCAD